MKPASAWQKGQSGNPGGRPKLPDSVQRLKEQGKIAAIEGLSQALLMNSIELDVNESNPDTPAALRIAIALIKKTIKTGCPIRAQLIYQYMIGKPETYTPDPPEPTEADDNTIRLAYSQDDVRNRGS